MARKRGGPRTSAKLNIEIKNLGPLSDRLSREMPAVFTDGLLTGIRAATIHLSGKIKLLLEGPVLTRRTGRLFRSIQPETFLRAGTAVGIVGTDVEYAAVHEFGATIKPKAKGGLLVWESDGIIYSAKSVKIPRRPFFSRAFKAESGKASKIIREEVTRKAREAFEGSGSSGAGGVLPASQRAGISPRGAI